MKHLNKKASRLLEEVDILLHKGENTIPLSITKEYLEIINEVTNFINEEERNIISKKVEAILSERINLIKDKNTHIKQNKNAKVIAHLISLSSIKQENYTIDLAPLRNRATDVPLLSGFANDYKFNYEGYTTFHTYSGSYVQIFRNGYLEVVDTKFFNEDHKQFYVTRFETSLIENITKYIHLFSSLGLEGPFLLNIVILGAKDFSIVLNFDQFLDTYPNEKEKISLPQILIEDYQKPLASTLKPAFDVLWNTFGIYGSINYINGERTPKK
ncbi:hypothetical protein [Priestia aryabhattai]|uniref:hypothetical protein n=1 Tax=Priestia aryabhattai TaxID=412384 RepID=UPI00245325F3|nr:hypothetical protein [Priestia aryabhattai]MDH3111458.1 hypothetical protein [Priestia aryabhattai]MDH3129621.1 hypothetical protein [Priestia aryabhattai]